MVRRTASEDSCCEDIQREVRRGTLFRCVVCKQAGASVGCSIKSCRNVGHVPCLQTKNYLFQYFGCFATFCPKHRPNQKALLMMNESISTECCICLSAIQLDDDFRKLFCPSCLTPFHRECIQVCQCGVEFGQWFLAPRETLANITP